MSVLIVTRSDDNDSVELVAEHVRAAGVDAVRFDTDRFPTESRLACELDSSGDRLTLVPPSGEAVDLTRVTAVYYRRFAVGQDIPRDLDPQLRRPSVEESRRTVFGLLAALHAFRLDPVERVKHAHNKQLQLRLAREVGLAIPKTLISNDPEAVRRFAARCPAGVITKMQASFAVYDEQGREKVVFTNPLTEADLADLDGLSLSPMQFQERVPKAVELRVTVAGRRLFAAAIDSQSSELATEDWRRDGVGMLEQWVEHDLPTDVSERLFAVCDHLGLEYGAMDLILTPDGRYVFLEINPVGEYFWLEEFPGFPISQALAQVLVDPTARRVP